MEIKFFNNQKPWFYTIKKADTMEEFNITNFSKKFNFNIADFEILNGKIKSVSVGDVVVIPTEHKYFHVVKPTETLFKIANMFNVEEEYLKNLNNINKIFIGQKIFI